ncbi:testis-expressed protein 36 isoform X2 [Notamacropus eugenii]|uniref:testis-expressed protein 36 isoform X2 n=1 Tax=Notamacropus eugenii TaxID=9315 RepID=UPI003B6783FB
MEQPEPMEPASPAETFRGTLGSRACPATWVSPACPVILVSPASSATPCSQNCPAMSVSPARSTTSGSRTYPATPVSSACSAIPRSRTCPATPVSPACSATPGPRASPATLGSPASSATLCSQASPDTLGSPASPDTLGSPAFSVTSAAQAPPTFPSSSLLYSHVSRIIASRKQKAGIWFPHIGLIEKTPESTTTAMMKQPFLPESKRKVEEWLPSRYQLRQQPAETTSHFQCTIIGEAWNSVAMVWMNV